MFNINKRKLKRRLKKLKRLLKGETVTRISNEGEKLLIYLYLLAGIIIIIIGILILKKIFEPPPSLYEMIK